jgi:DNA-binding NtrC family response regulator
MPGKKRILIVDDEPVIVSTLATVFANEGYESRAAESAQQAIELLSNWSPHLAIIDIKLREMSGVEFALHLKELCPGCQVALFTGLTDLADLLDKVREANHHFQVLQKPTHPAEVLRLAAAWLSEPEEPELSTA